MDVPYHVGEAASHSLAFVTRDEADLHEFISERQPTNPQVRSFDAPSGTRIFTVYTLSEPSDGSTPESWSDADFDGNGQLVTALLTAFDAVNGASDLRENKSLDLDKLPRAFERVEWRQSVPEVAGEMFSNLVLAHALPNANHRSSLTLTNIYLESQDKSATLAQDCSNSPMESLANEFFADSKRLLTVRRNATKFDILRNEGVSTVTRKGDVTIDLNAYNFGTSDPYAHFAEEHRHRSIKFIEEYLELAGLDDLCEMEDSGKHAFVQAMTRW